MNLRRAAIRGGQWTTVGTAAVTTLQLIKLAVLARFLSPEEFGLMAIVMVVVGFSQAFSDMGISNAIIHRQEITAIQLSSLYWLNIFSGMVLTGIVIALAPLVAIFYDRPDLQLLTTVIAAVFLITAIGQQFRILCQKHMRFGTIAGITTAAELVSTGVAIYLAWRGFGVWALVFSVLIAAALNAAGFLSVGLFRHHRPLLIYRHDELKGFFSFALYQMGERSINYISANIDKILIGRMVGMGAVGFYNLAWQLIIFPLSRINPIVNMVAFPAYAKLQADPSRRERYYAASVKLLSLITIPLLVFLFFYADQIVLLAFGPGWGQTGSLVQILAIVGVAKALGNPGGALILSMGRADIGFWWNVFWASLISVGLFLALWIEPTVESAAYTLLVLSLTTGLIWHYLIARIGKVKYWPIARHFGKVSLVSLLIGISASYLTNLFAISTNFLVLLVAMTLFGLFYLIYLALFERRFLLSIIGNR